MTKKGDQSNKSDSVDLEELLREKERLDSIIKRKFTRRITCMFTDLTGSTRMSEMMGDLEWRTVLKNHNEIVFPSIASNNGVLVKTMGDGTMSYFNDAIDAVRSAIAIQRGIEEYNTRHDHPPLLMRCGLNTGLGIVEKEDVHGDVVNVAQRYEALAEPKEILMSEDTFKLVEDSDELCVTFQKETMLKGKMGPQRVFKALWHPEDMERFKENPNVFNQTESVVDGAVTGEMPTPLVKGAGFEAATMDAPRAAATITVDQEGKEPVIYDISKPEAIIGRSSNADIVLAEGYVSRKHAKITSEGGKYYIEDLKSNIGTVYHGKKITRHEITDGEKFMVGTVKLIFNIKQDSGDDFGDGEATMIFDTKKMLSVVAMEGEEVIGHKELSSGLVVIGRLNECDIKLANPLVSRRHAKITRPGEDIFIEDLKSNNGTFVNDEQINKVKISVEDKIRIGPFSLRIVDPSKSSGDDKNGAASLSQKMFAFLSKK